MYVHGKPATSFLSAKEVRKKTDSEAYVSFTLIHTCIAVDVLRQKMQVSL